MPKHRAPRRQKAPISLRMVEGFGANYSLPTGGANTITPQVALRVTAILAVVRFIAQSLASMPLSVMRRDAAGRRTRASDLAVARCLSKMPNSWQSSYEWIETMAHHTALWGNGFSLIVPGDAGFCTALHPLHPSRMTVQRANDGSLTYRYEGVNRVYAQDEIVHFRWMSDNSYTGMVPSELCATSLALARKLDIAASAYWDNSARPDVVLETQEVVPPEAVAALKAQWREIYGGVRNRGSAAILPRKMNVKTIDSSTMEAAQFQELRNSIVTEIARAYGVPSTLVGDTSNAKYSTVEQEFISAQVFCLLPWQRRFEGTLDRSILSTYGADVYSKLDSRGLLRGDSASRSALYQSLFNMAAITPNEIRDLEDFEPLDDPAANQTFLQLGFSTLTNAATAQPVAIPGA